MPLSRLGCVRLAEHDLLDLVEIVDAVQPARILARGPCLPAKTRGAGEVQLRQLRLVENLVAVIAGDRHLRGADEALAVALAEVDFFAVQREEARAVHERVVDQHGHGHRQEPTLGHHVEREPQYGFVQ